MSLITWSKIWFTDKEKFDNEYLSMNTTFVWLSLPSILIKMQGINICVKLQEAFLIYFDETC